MTYNSWFNEINTTKMNKQNGQVKIYKMILLLCMLDRGIFDWFKPVKPEDIALNYYRYLTDNELISNISFGNKGNKMLILLYNEKQMAYSIRTNPMTYWNGGNSNSLAKFNGKEFWININIQPEDFQYVYYMTRQLCIKRIEKETGIPFDVKINLHEEYIYQQNEVEKEMVAETERESIIMTRIGQGKFRNRLFERYDRCVLCGIQHKELLIASHIKPWKDSNKNEKLDVNNGLILCPNHDRLFDRGFITIKDDGEIITSQRIERDISKLNVNNSILVDLSRENKGYLEWHREKVFHVANIY
ncbi:MAG: HNH endonuclease [Eubacteriales bacterium]